PSLDSHAVNRGYADGRYLQTETDPTVPSHVKSITTTEKSNWNTAYSWGNHSKAGYAMATRTIYAGTGITGGGSLAANRTISFDTSWGDNRYAGKDYEKKIDVIDVRTLPNGSTTYDPKPSELN